MCMYSRERWRQSGDPIRLIWMAFLQLIDILTYIPFEALLSTCIGKPNDIKLIDLFLLESNVSLWLTGLSIILPSQIVRKKTI
jgi:hypothetical protein